MHKRLIERAFNNEVLMSIRKDKDKPFINNLEEPQSANMGDDAEKLTLADTIADVDLINDQTDKETLEAELMVVQEVKR